MLAECEYLNQKEKDNREHGEIIARPTKLKPQHYRKLTTTQFKKIKIKKS